MIKLEEFVETYLPSHPTPFYKWNDGEVQVCLEPCAAGMCVGIYDGNDWILAEKKCTNMPGAKKEDVFARAVELANEIYQEWRSNHVIE